MKPIRHITGRESLLAALNIMPNDDFAQRSNRAHGLLARAGRWQFLPLAVILATVAIALLIVAAFASGGGIVITLLAGAFLFLAILAAIWFKPALLANSVRHFEDAASDHLKLREAGVSGKCEDEQKRLNDTISAWIQESIANGATLNQIVNDLNECVVEVEQSKEALAAEIEATSQQERISLEKSRIEKSALHAAAARWSSRLFSGITRKPARRAVSAIEAQTSLTEKMTTLRAAFNMIEYAHQALTEAKSHFSDELLHPLLRLKDVTTAEIRALELEEKSGCPLLSLKPSIAELRSPVQAAVQMRVSQIRQGLVRRRNSESADEAMRRGVADVIGESAVVPQTIAEYWSQCNGESTVILDNIDAESKAYSVVDATPGRIHVLIRYCLADGGAGSPAFEPVRGRSQGISVRGIDHQDSSDLIVATLEKFVPASEQTEFRHAAKAFDQAPKDVQSAIIYICKEDNVIRHYTPEQCADRERGLRLLFFGQLWNEIGRTGSEEYRYTTTTGEQVLISKGWEASALQIQTDKTLADHLEARINRCQETEGEAATKARLQKAFESPGDWVPTAAVSKFREIIAAELDHNGYPHATAAA